MYNFTWKLISVLIFFIFSALGLAASAAPTPGRGGSLDQSPDPREGPTLSPRRSLARALANHAVPPRARSLAPARTLGSRAPRADQNSRTSADPEVVPRRGLLARGLGAALGPVRRAETRSPLNLLARTTGPPSPRSSALRPAPSPALDPDQFPKTERFCYNKLEENEKSMNARLHPSPVPLECLWCLPICTIWKVTSTVFYFTEKL